MLLLSQLIQFSALFNFVVIACTHTASLVILCSGEGGKGAPEAEAVCQNENESPALRKSLVVVLAPNSLQTHFLPIVLVRNVSILVFPQ